MNTTRNLSYELRRIVDGELNGDESIMWTGQPKPSGLAVKSLPIVLFALPWTAFSIFWICGASGFKIPDFSEGGFSFFPLFGLPFVLIGLGMLCAPFWVMKKAKNTVYVLTNNRAIIFEGGRRTHIRSFGPTQLRDLLRKQRADGSGDIVFKREISYNNEGSNTPIKELGFFGIDNVKEVEDMIRAVAKGN